MVEASSPVGEPPGDGVAVGDLVDGVVDRPADPDVGDGAGPPVRPKNQEPQAPRGVDRRPPGPCRVGPERGDLGLWHVAVQRQVGLLGVDRPLDGPVRTASVTWILSTQALRSGSEAASQSGLRSNTANRPRM
jgi:hypothetical protein